MNSSTRRTFLKNIFLLTGYTAFVPALAWSSNKKNHPLKLPTDRSSVRLFHSTGLQVPAGHLQQYTSGGIKNVHQVFEKFDETFLAIDSGGFLNHQNSVEENLVFLQKMNHAGFSTAGLGKEELIDGGRLLKTVIDKLNFTVVNCNYRFGDSTLADGIKPYHIIYYGDTKIGITGIAPDYKVSRVTYKNPVTSANTMAERLKVLHQCDLVFCISGMDQNYTGNQPYYSELAAQSSFIDMILNAHSEKITPRLQVVKNRVNNDILVSSVAGSGLYLGAYDIEPGEHQSMMRFVNHSTAPGISQPATIASLLNELEQSAVNA